MHILPRVADIQGFDMAIFLHTGNRKSIKSDEIVGFFDMDTSTISKITRDFLNANQKNGTLNDTLQDIPRTFIVHKNNERKSYVTLSQLSSGTLYDRLKRKI